MGRAFRFIILFGCFLSTIACGDAQSKSPEFVAWKDRVIDVSGAIDVEQNTLDQAFRLRADFLYTAQEFPAERNYKKLNKILTSYDQLLNKYSKSKSLKHAHAADLTTMAHSLLRGREDADIDLIKSLISGIETVRLESPSNEYYAEKSSSANWVLLAKMQRTRNYADYEKVFESLSILRSLFPENKIIAGNQAGCFHIIASNPNTLLHYKRDIEMLQNNFKGDAVVPVGIAIAFNKAGYSSIRSKDEAQIIYFLDRMIELQNDNLENAKVAQKKSELLSSHVHYRLANNQVEKAVEYVSIIQKMREVFPDNNEIAGTEISSWGALHSYSDRTGLGADLKERAEKKALEILKQFPEDGHIAQVYNGIFGRGEADRALGHEDGAMRLRNKKRDTSNDLIRLKSKD